jgi:integrase
MTIHAKNDPFGPFTTTPADNTIDGELAEAIRGESVESIPRAILVVAKLDQTMRLNLPAVANLDLTPVEWPSEQQPAIVYLSSLSLSSRRPQAVALAAIASILTGSKCPALQLPWHRLRFIHTNAVRATLAERYAPATANRYLAALRGVIRACWQLDLIDQQTLAKTLNFKPIPGQNEEAAAGRSLSFREMTTLMQHLSGQGINGLRDAALIAVAYAGGLRRQEIANLDLDDYDSVNGTLRVLRKRQKRHTVYIEDQGTKDVLGEWLKVRGSAPGPLFYRVHKGGRLEAVASQARLHPQTISDMIARRAKQTGLTKLTPHDLRRTTISDLLDAGVDLATVQKLVGHSNANTTARYDRRGERAKRAAAAKLHVPWQGQHV